MINAQCQDKPVLIPHHTGRKRFHLELKENLAKMGVELKNSIINSMKSAMYGINSLIYGSKPEQQQPQGSSSSGEQTKNSSNDQDQGGAGDSTTKAAVEAATQEFITTQQNITRNESGDRMQEIYKRVDQDNFGLLNSGRRI